MKCKYYLCMMLFSFMVLFHQYSLVKADETESTLTQKYFKLSFITFFGIEFNNFVP